LSWNAERSEFKEKIHRAGLDLQDAKNKNRSQEDDFNQKLAEKNYRIAQLQGEVAEARSKGQQLQSQVQVSA
jgi:predicted  nucleic acid-binding Zn-ribbon protein